MGATVYITAKCTKKYPNSTFYTMQMKNVEYMNAVKDKSIEKVTIIADAANIDESTATDLSTIVSNNPGKTQLYFQLIDREHNTSVTLRLPDKGINLSKEIMDYVENNEELSYSIN